MVVVTPRADLKAIKTGPLSVLEGDKLKGASNAEWCSRVGTDICGSITRIFIKVISFFVRYPQKSLDAIEIYLFGHETSLLNKSVLQN